MKLSISTVLTSFFAISVAACGGMENGDLDTGDEVPGDVAESEDAVTSVNDCAQNFNANAVFEQSKMDTASGDSYTRSVGSLTCSNGAPREMTIVKAYPYHNHCYRFQNISTGATLTELANESFPNCVSTKFWGQLNFWDGTQFQNLLETTMHGEVVIDFTKPNGWYCSLPWGTEFKFFNGAGLTTTELKVRAKVTRADGEIANVKMVAFDVDDWSVCGVWGNG